MQKPLALLMAGLVGAGLCLGTARAETTHKKKTSWHGTHIMTGTVTGALGDSYGPQVTSL